MATVERFEDLQVWKLARVLAGKIYRLSRQEAFARDYGFRDQIQRAVVSIVSNIAEGFERQSNSQFLHFLDIAIGSAGEVRAQLYLALDFGYITEEQFRETSADVLQVSRMLTKLMQYLRTVPNRLQPSNCQTVKPSNLTPQLSNCQTVKPSNQL